MKVSKILILLNIVNLLWSANLALAGETDSPDKCVTYSGNDNELRKKMCECSQNFLSELSKDPKVNFDEEKAKLTKLQSKVKIINDVSRLVDNYKNDLSNISSPVNKPNLEKKLTEYRKTIYDATLLNGINTFISKNKNLIEDKDFTLDKLCTQKANDESYGFLCEYKTKNDHWYKKSYIDTFKRFIETYKQANANGKDFDLDAKLKAIISDIPAEVNPQFISNLAEKFSPELKQKMDQATSNLEKTCKEKAENCIPTFINFQDEDNSKIIEELNQHSQRIAENDFSQSDKKSAFNTKIKEYISGQMKSSYNAFKKTREDEINEAFNNYASPMSKFPLGKLTDLNSILNKEFNKNFGLDQIAADFRSKCVNRSQEKTAISDSDKLKFMNDCNAIIQKIYDVLNNNEIKSMNEELSKAQKQFLEKMNSPEVRENNKVKNFIANNYMRNCNQNNSSAQLVNGCLNDVLSPITNFKLADSTFDIIGKISADSMTETAFSSQELNDVKNICSKNRDKYSLTCKIVDQEFQMAKGQKTTQDWKDLNEKYWVKYDPKSRTGYTLTEKKSWARMLGEAAVPAFTNNVGYWMYNYQQSYVIDQMQQQALLQKQWMWDYNQAQTYWMANYFNTSSTTTNFTSTNSYNFGN